MQFRLRVRDTGVKVNRFCPGYTGTDLNQRRGTQTLEQRTAQAVRLRFQTNATIRGIMALFRS